jgi:hypothetical protein
MNELPQGRTQINFTPAAFDETCWKPLLRIASGFATTIGMIVRQCHGPSPTQDALLAALQPYLVREERVRAWPGSELMEGRTCERRLYRVTPEVVEVVLGAARNLGEWCNPKLPDDLHLLRDDGSVVLASITQEDDVWIELGSVEYARFNGSAPPELLASIRDVRLV